jgi:steroid 5-alpha reductase family enzyme
MGLTMWATLTVVWGVGTALRNHSLMDVAYPITPWLAAMVAWQVAGGDLSSRSLALLACLTLWSWRLSGYIGLRYLPHGEEARYARWRARGGTSWWWWSYFQIYLTQGVIVWIWTWPVALALQAPGPLSVWAWLAVGVWAMGFVFEVGGDWQMHRFRTNPANKGRVMDRGFWAWCRHPNYFGESMMWLGYGLFALSHPWGWLGLPSVAMVFWFMNRGSATSMTERYMLKTKPGYADYMARTPAFFPRPPRRVP